MLWCISHHNTKRGGRQFNMGFNVGDKVISVEYHPDDNKFIEPGLTGIIRAIIPEENWLPIGVEWDSNINGNTLGGFCKSGYGWWVNEQSIRLYNEDEDESFYIATEDELNRFLLGTEE